MCGVGPNCFVYWDVSITHRNIKHKHKKIRLRNCTKKLTETYMIVNYRHL